MGSATTQSLHIAQQRLQDLGSPEVAADLFATARAFHQVPQLAATLSDQMIPVAARASLFASIFKGKLSESGVAFVSGLLDLAFSSKREFVDSVEKLGIIALSGNDARELATQLISAARVIGGNWDLAKALGNPLAAASDKAALVQRLFGGKLGEAATSVISYVSETRATGKLVPTLRTLATDALKAAGLQLAQITSAQPLDADSVAKLVSSLKSTFGDGLVPVVTVDPSLVGGAKVAVGSQVIDGSVRTKLRSLRSAFAA